MNTKEKVIEILHDLSGVEEISEGASFKEDLGFDSLLMVSMLIEFEEEFDIELKESDMNPYDLKTEVSTRISMIRVLTKLLECFLIVFTLTYRRGHNSIPS